MTARIVADRLLEGPSPSWPRPHAVPFGLPSSTRILPQFVLLCGLGQVAV
jgi:hypothetical protein